MFNLYLYIVQCSIRNFAVYHISNNSPWWTPHHYWYLTRWCSWLARSHARGRLFISWLRDTQFVPKVVTVPRPEHPATGVNVTASRRCRYIRIYSVTKEEARYRTLTDHWTWAPNICLNITSLKRQRRGFFVSHLLWLGFSHPKGCPVDDTFFCTWTSSDWYWDPLQTCNVTGLFMTKDFQIIFVKFDIIYCMWPLQLVVGC